MAVTPEVVAVFQVEEVVLVDVVDHQVEEAMIEMHDAICDQCGKPCKVPFRPSGDRPIYCSECFEEKGGGERRDDRRDNRRSYGDRGGRGEGRSDRYGDNRRSFDRPVQSQSMSQEQFQILNEKLDRILKALSVVVPRRVEDHVEGEEERFEFHPKKKVRIEDDQKITLQ